MYKHKRNHPTSVVWGLSKDFAVEVDFEFPGKKHGQSLEGSEHFVEGQHGPSLLVFQLRTEEYFVFSVKILFHFEQL